MATIPEQQEPETTVRPDPNARWRNWKPTSLRMKEGFYVSGSFANNPQVQQIHRGQTLNVLQPQQMEQIKNTFTPNPDVYWDNPVRVARYYNFLRAQPPGYQAPEWLDTQQVNAAYNYLKYKNNDRPWTEWKPLQQDDPGKEFIRNMPAPPNDMRFGQEPLKPDQPTTVQSSTSEPFGDWNNLNPWQQIMLGIFSPQPGLANRPEATRLTASAFQGVMAGLGGAAVGAAIGGVPGALIGGVGVGLGTTYQTYTGNEVPVLSQALMLFDLPAQWLEQGIGVGAQIATDGLDEVMQNLPAAWEAGQLTYETAQADLTNLVAQIAGDEAAGPGEVWQIQKGLSDPQKLQAERGTAALNAARKRIEGGEDITAVYLDYVERFGFTGTLNDFVGQSLLDPTQMAPFLEGRAGSLIADAAGNKRLAAAFRDTTGSPLIDVLPMGLKQIAEAVTGQHESAGLMGAIETYKNYIKTGYFPEGTTPLAPDQLSGFEKRIAGLDEQGRIKEMQPASGKGGVAGFVEYINNLTPEAKANVFLDNMLDNLKFLLAEADGDPDAMVDILNRAAGITPTQAGQAGERLIKSPYTATAAAAYYDFLKTGMTKELLAEWHAGDARRPLLEKIAKALDETPAEIIRQANDNIDVLARRVNERAPGLGEPKFIAEMLKPFTGDDAIPYDPVQFQAKLTNVMFDQSGEWLVKRFGIKQAGAVTRITGVLKSAQSLLLLNLNPAYFLNNAINNVATRAAVGVFGFWTPGKLNKFLNDFGITPERLSEGVTPTGEVAGQAGRVISDVVKGNDAITQAQRIVSAVSDKIGIFSRASAAVEGMESKQAYVIGMSKFYSKAWRKGKGFDRMSDALVSALEREAPGSSAAIYAAVEAGMNWNDIERSITGEITKPAIGEILDAAAQTINPENPDAARELIDTTGVRQELETRLQNAETPQQAAAAFNAAEEKLQDFIDETFKRELVTRAEDVKAQVQKEGYPAALGLFTDLQVKIAMHWLQHLEDMENLFNKGQARAPGADMNDAISNSLQLAEREWSRLNSFELQTTAGILKAIGIESEAAGKFTDLMGQLHNGWKKFFEDRNARYREVFNMKKNRGENYADFQVRKNKAYRQASEQISRDFQKMAERENLLNENMSDVFAKAFEQSTKMSGDGARAWRKRVIELRKQMQREMTEFRNTIQGMDGDARRQAWADFQPRYRELVVQLKEIEIEGAHQLARQPMSDTITKAMRDKLRNAGYDNAQIRNMTPEQINFEIAKAEGRDTQDLTNPQAKAILDMARAAGAVDKNGDPIPQYALNIINRRSNVKYDDLAKVPLDVAQKAMDEHQRKHRHEATRKKIREIINARNILDMADADARENALRAEGLMSRRMVREMLANEINATPEQVDAAIVAMDAHADALTLNAGGTPTEATRDAWYAQHWANENDSGGGTQLFQFEKPPASGDLHPWAKIAKDHFGVTDNIREAGFILPDGTMLDLSGRHYASGFTKRGDRWVAEPGQRDYLRNQRDVDHRDLPEEIQAPPGTFEWQDNNSNTANMLYFLNQSGAVRIDYNSGMITIGAPITTAQASILSNWFSDGWIEVDSPTTGEQIWDQEFSGAKRTKMRSLLAEANDRIVSASGGGATEARIESLRQDFISGLTNYYEGNDGNPYRALDYAMGSIVELARQGKTPAQLQQLLTENGFGKLPAEKLMQGIRYARALAEEGTLRQNQRGSISFLEDGRAILRGLQSPDVTTMMHEIGHVFRADLNDADTGVIAQWGGLTNGEELRDLTYQFRDGTISEADRARYVAAEEKFAQGWEEYLARGDAPTPELRNIFQRFTDWFKQIYGDLKRRFGKVDIDATVAGVKISDVMDRMLTVKPNRTDALAQAVGPATPPPPPRNPMHVAIADGKVTDLPDHVSAGMRDVASWLEGEIARSKISLITDADTGETTRIWEDGPYWYRQMLDKMIENEKNSGSKKVDAEVKAEAEAAGETVDEQINSGNLKEKLISALKQIAKGKENPNLKRVQLAKGLIIDAALGNFGELESRATASLQWAWGDKEGVFTDWGDNIYDEAWLTQNFGPEADDVLTEYLLWQSDQNPIQQETTSAVDQVEAEWQRNQEAAAKFEAGAPVDINDLPAEITPAPPIGETQTIKDARTRILEGLNAEEKAYALNVIDWLNNGGDEPATTLPLMRAGEIFDRVAAEADSLTPEAGPITLSDTIDTNSDTIQAARVHSFEHGDNTIAAAIYQNGEVVALLPDNADVASTFETDAGPARLLGLDPDDPAKWVVEKDGEVESIDPERPELAKTKQREVRAQDIQNAIEQRKNGRLTIRDVYAENKAPREMRGVDSFGNERFGYAYSPEYFLKSDATGMPMRYYVELENGAKVHPDELDRVHIDKEGRVRIDSEKFTVIQEGSRKVSYKNFSDAVWNPASYLTGDKSTTIRTSSGFEITLTRKEWTYVWQSLRSGKNYLTFAEWLDQYGDAYKDAIKAPAKIEEGNQRSGTLYQPGIDDTRNSFIDGIEQYHTGGGNAMQALDRAIAAIAGIQGSKTPDNVRVALEANGFNNLPADKIMQGVRYARDLIDTKAQNFMRWFGDSKVTDTQGNPIIVYHGTPTGGFEEFRNNYKRGQDLGFGIHFAEDQNFADVYTQSKRSGAATRGTNVKGSQIYQVYLKIENPLDLTGIAYPGSPEYEFAKKVNPSAMKGANYRDGVYLKNLLDTTTPQRAERLIKEAGYDGVIYEGENRIWVSQNSYQPMEKTKAYIVFDSTQIKDVRNRGTYDPNNPNILYQPASDQPTAPLPEQPAPVMGDVPMGATPSPEPAGETLNEIGAEHVRPMLRKMQEEYTNRLGQAPYRWDSLSQETQAELRRYMNKVKDQQASTKYATMKYGEQMRDSALLNYSRRYGIDTYLNMVFPYQFWYTRSMMNWAKRMIDRPSWFAMYARMQQAQEKMERNGMPTRLKGKMRMPAPWLPDWAGGGLWVDPASKLLPFATFGQPFEQYASDRNMIAKRAETILQDMVDGDQITTSQMQEALRTRQGKAWEMATSQAQVELDKNGNPVNLVGMMMSPALYWSAPAALLEGKPEKISVMPITRTGQAIRTATQGTGLQGIGNFIGNALAMPEEKIRGAAGLSNFGEWGDYLIDRTLANMAADGTIDNDAARIAMIERQGPAYEEAYRRVEYEQMLRTPGAATLQQVAQGNIKGAAQSLPTVLLSGGLFPEGELKLRGLKGEYDKAWLDYKNGDEKALNNFFDAHPEYESRLALYTEPEDRLKKFLIGEVWDRYSSLEKTNRALASKELGATFRDAFLNSDTRSYDSIDVETLSMWAQQLGGSSPNVPETAGAMDTQVMDMYPPEFNQVIEDYQGARAEQFPNYYALQQEYYSLPEKSYQRRQFLKRFPELKDYWTWNRAYKEQHPEINQYYDDIYGDQPDTLSDQEFSRVDPVVLREVYFATLTGSDISTAVNRELTRLAKQSGMTVEEYQAALLATFAQSQMTQ